MTVLLVFLGGALGSALRYNADRMLQARTGGRFPWGTLAVNLIGCFVLGVVASGAAHRHWGSATVALLGTGFCGGLTTFSTFSVESMQLARTNRRALAGYLIASLGAGIGLAALGWQLTAG